VCWCWDGWSPYEGSAIGLSSPTLKIKSPRRGLVYNVLPPPAAKSHLMTPEHLHQLYAASHRSSPAWRALCWPPRAVRSALWHWPPTPQDAAVLGPGLGAVLTLDTYADLFPDDLEMVSAALDDARRTALESSLHESAAD
jgi:hypothetical protein